MIQKKQAGDHIGDECDLHYSVDKYSVTNKSQRSRGEFFCCFFLSTRTYQVRVYINNVWLYVDCCIYLWGSETIHSHHDVQSFICGERAKSVVCR